MKTIPFDIKLRKDIQSEENHYQGRYKVQTRDGNDVRIIYWDSKDKRNKQYPIVGLQTINDTKFITTWTKDGKYTLDAESNNNDLILIDTWEPKFKVGDTIKRIKQTPGLEDDKVTIKEIRNYSYYFSDDSWMYLFEQDGWELVPEESKLTEFETMTREEAIKELRGFLGQLTEGCQEVIKVLIPELNESEDERIRKECISIVKQYMNICAKEGDSCLCGNSVINWLERQTIKQTAEDIALRNYPDIEISKRIQNIIRKTFTSGFIEGVKFQKEQKPTESDAIKGGDFISDEKRVFLVLANVKERNLGQTGSTFCEGLILGVDGVVYCNGDDFKKFKRATSDERAKFIHDLNVGVELKEQPTEWSEEEKRKLNRIYEILGYAADDKGFLTSKRIIGDKEAIELQDFLKSLRPQPKVEWNEEDEDKLMDILEMIKYTDALPPTDIPSCTGHLHLSNEYKEKLSSWLKNRLKSPHPQPHTVSIKDATKFGNLEYERGVKDGIQGEKSRHWKPSEEQMEALERASTNEYLSAKQFDILVSLYEQLKKLM